jgi:hypothetical protein
VDWGSVEFRDNLSQKIRDKPVALHLVDITTSK